MYDLCIIGNGMFGSAAARHASVNPVVKVALIGPREPAVDERPKREIFSSHYDEGRVTRVLDEHITYQELARQSIKRYKELEKFSGIKFYNPIGLLTCGQRHIHAMEVIKQSLSFGKVPCVELTNEHVADRYPYIVLKSDEVVYFDDNGAGYISPRKMVAAQQKVAEMQGCTMINDIAKEVSTLCKNDTGTYHEIICEKGVAIQAKRVLVCTGAFTNFNKLVRNEKNLVPDLNVLPETAAMIRVSAEEAERIRAMPSMVFLGSESSELRKMGAYIIPPIKYPDNEYYIKVGPMSDPEEIHTIEEARKWYLTNGDEKIANSHAKLLMELMPSLKVLDVKGLACLSARTPSGLPYIDRVTPTLSVAIGGNVRGAKFSDEVGRIAAELSVYGRWVSELPEGVYKVIWKKP